MDHITHLAAEQKPVSERKFGLLFTAVFLGLCLFALYRGRPVWQLWLALSGLFGILTLVAPVVLKPLRIGWMWFGSVMHRVTSPIFLGSIFVLVFVPVGLIWRLTGKDPLRIKFDRNSQTYWISRTAGKLEPESLRHQF